jgi:hypothetical protein
VEGLFDAGIDEFNNEFNHRLEAGRNTGTGLFCDPPEHEKERKTEYQRPHKRIYMERPKPHIGSLGSTMGDTPAAIGVLPKGQVLQMMLYVFA